MSYVVRNVSQAVNEERDVNFYSETCKSFGFFWWINVHIHQDEMNKCKYVSIYLFANDGDYQTFDRDGRE